MLRSILIATAIAMAAGCYGTVSAYDYDGYGYYGGDDYVAPGVSVVGGYDYPVFYNDNTYWAYYGNRWYSSPYAYGGWAIGAPPAVILGIHNPYRYHYPHGSPYYANRYHGHNHYGGYHGGYHGGYRGGYHDGYHGGHRGSGVSHGTTGRTGGVSHGHPVSSHGGHRGGGHR